MKVDEVAKLGEKANFQYKKSGIQKGCGAGNHREHGRSQSKAAEWNAAQFKAEVVGGGWGGGGGGCGWVAQFLSEGGPSRGSRE